MVTSWRSATFSASRPPKKIDLNLVVKHVWVLLPCLLYFGTRKGQDMDQTMDPKLKY